MYTPGRLVAGGVPSLRDFVAELGRDIPSAVLSPAAGDTEAELSALGSGADFVAFQDFLGVPTLALEFLFEGNYGFGGYHSTYDSRFYMEHVADPGFVKGAELARVLGVAVMRLAGATILPFRYSHYAARIESFLRAAEGWASESQSATVVVDTRDLQALASQIAARARDMERAIDEGLANGRAPAQAAGINDALARLEQTLLDASEPAAERWYRHVVYGWNIYSMYDGQPLPSLAEAIRVADATAVTREQERLRLALTRMQRGVEEIAGRVSRAP